MQRFTIGAVGGLVAFALCTALAVSPAMAEPIDEVPSGTKLGKDNWEVAKGLLPDEILEFYKRGEYSNPIIQKEGSAWLTARPPQPHRAPQLRRGPHLGGGPCPRRRAERLQ